jgi:hypothetical protein
MTLDTSAGDARIAHAEAKRARKAAKRQRDAELTRLGRKASRLTERKVIDLRRTSLALSPRKLLKIERARRRAGWRPWWRVTTRSMGPDAMGVVRRMRAIRRGAVTP